MTARIPDGLGLTRVTPPPQPVTVNSSGEVVLNGRTYRIEHIRLEGKSYAISDLNDKPELLIRVNEFVQKTFGETSIEIPPENNFRVTSEGQIFTRKIGGVEEEFKSNQDFKDLIKDNFGKVIARWKFENDLNAKYESNPSYFSQFEANSDYAIPSLNGELDSNDNAKISSLMKEGSRTFRPLKKPLWGDTPEKSNQRGEINDLGNEIQEVIESSLKLRIQLKKINKTSISEEIRTGENSKTILDNKDAQFIKLWTYIKSERDECERDKNDPSSNIRSVNEARLAELGNLAADLMKAENCVEKMRYQLEGMKSGKDVYRGEVEDDKFDDEMKQRLEELDEVPKLPNLPTRGRSVRASTPTTSTSTPAPAPAPAPTTAPTPMSRITPTRAPAPTPAPARPARASVTATRAKVREKDNTERVKVEAEKKASMESDLKRFTPIEDL